VGVGTDINIGRNGSLRVGLIIGRGRGGGGVRNNGKSGRCGYEDQGKGIGMERLRRKHCGGEGEKWMWGGGGGHSMGFETGSLNRELKGVKSRVGGGL
jgi:hypothetical protein